jgi:hypothetical protein
MKKYLVQLLNSDELIGLYKFPIVIEDKIIRHNYYDWRKEDTDIEFEDWWNSKNPEIQIERVYVEEVYV